MPRDEMRFLHIVTITVNQYSPRNRRLEDELCATFPLNRAIVVKTFADGASNSVRRTVGYIAAPLVSELIQPNMVIGTAGGRTLYHLAQYLQPVSHAHGNTIVQLMGNIGSYVGEIDAYELGRVLAQKLNGSHTPRRRFWHLTERRRENIAFVLFILPNLSLLALWTFWPFFHSVYLSLNWNLL